MTDQHPITPPPELVQQWYREADSQLRPYYVYIALRAARWGADQELEASLEWLVQEAYIDAPCRLRAARRPKPPSLKEQALLALAHLDKGAQPHMDTTEASDTIRRALEALDD